MDTHPELGPTVDSVKVERGAAGALQVLGSVTYPDEAPRRFVFAGNVYGGPVAYTFTLADGRHVSGFVAEPSRFGTFHDDPERWARRFHAGA